MANESKFIARIIVDNSKLIDTDEIIIDLKSSFSNEDTNTHTFISNPLIQKLLFYVSKGLA